MGGSVYLGYCESPFTKGQVAFKRSIWMILLRLICENIMFIVFGPKIT